MTAKFSLSATGQFKRDVKKHLPELFTESWTTISYCLIHGIELPAKYRNHQLKGNFSGVWECHVKPDLLLLYQIHGDVLKLIRLGTHAEIFG